METNQTQNRQDPVLLSIIIPAYNAKDYITECIDSIVVRQDNRYDEKENAEIEIILVDDGSTDGSSQICDELCKSLNINNPNGKGWKRTVLIP